MTPTEKQSALLGHETAFNRVTPGGGFCVTHDSPPVIVPMMVEPVPVVPVFPTAIQSSALEHEMLVRSTALEGGLWGDQVEPSFEVPMTYVVELRFVPTAIQVVSIGQASEFS